MYLTRRNLEARSWKSAQNSLDITFLSKEIRAKRGEIGDVPTLGDA